MSSAVPDDHLFITYRSIYSGIVINYGLCRGLANYLPIIHAHINNRFSERDWSIHNGSAVKTAAKFPSQTAVWNRSKLFAHDKVAPNSQPPSGKQSEWQGKTMADYYSAYLHRSTERKRRHNSIIIILSPWYWNIPQQQVISTVVSHSQAGPHWE